MLLLAKLRKDTILFFLPTRKSYQGKDRERPKARGHAECPAEKRRGQENLCLGAVWPSRRPTRVCLAFPLAMPDIPGTPARQDPLSPWGGRQLLRRSDVPGERYCFF